MTHHKFISKAFVIMAVIMLVLSSLLLTLVAFPTDTSAPANTSGDIVSTGLLLPQIMSWDIGIITGT